MCQAQPAGPPPCAAEVARVRPPLCAPVDDAAERRGVVEAHARPEQHAQHGGVQHVRGNQGSSAQEKLGKQGEEYLCVGGAGGVGAGVVRGRQGATVGPVDRRPDGSEAVGWQFEGSRLLRFVWARALPGACWPCCVRLTPRQPLAGGGPQRAQERPKAEAQAKVSKYVYALCTPWPRAQTRGRLKSDL